MIGNNNKNFQFPIFNFQKSKGFTLIELIVAMAVFSTVVTIVSSIFVSTMGSQRKNVNQQEVLENARYVLEIMARSIRQSTVQTTDGTSSVLAINHPVKGLITYQLDSDQIKESTGVNPALALSSSEVIIDKLSFIVQGNSLSDNAQPRVVIVVSLRNTEVGANIASSINLQTTVTPRNLQIQ
ncbi:MAG: prepilin-type N-terminal cleavage/methylation domain-containing protein [bacterium]|nr:prepilin-type N-terminal cleavage/methylation domain-containing protein [bacterium]